MTLWYDGTEIGHVLTNRSLTLKEALYAIGYDIDDEDDLKKAYEDEFPAAYQDDSGHFQIDTDRIEMRF